MRLFVAAEVIPPSVSRVSRFLRMQHNVDISCISFSVFETGSNEILVTTETIVGHEETSSLIFAPKDIAEVILKKYPNFNRDTINCQITSDCVNHPSRGHYPGGEDRYLRIAKGSFRIIQPHDLPAVTGNPHHTQMD